MISDSLFLIIWIVIGLAYLTIWIYTLTHMSKKKKWGYFILTLHIPTSFILFIFYWIHMRNAKKDNRDVKIIKTIKICLLFILVLFLIWVLIVIFSSSTISDTVTPTLTPTNSTIFPNATILSPSANVSNHINETLSTNTESSLLRKGFTYEFSKCVSDKLEAKGYGDKIDCIHNYNYTLCRDISRYNAEVKAKNECNGYE